MLVSTTTAITMLITTIIVPQPPDSCQRSRSSFGIGLLKDGISGGIGGTFVVMVAAIIDISGSKVELAGDDYLRHLS